MRSREDFDAILASTLEKGWSEQSSNPVHVRQSKTVSGQGWLFEGTISAFFIPSVDAAVRRFLRESLQYTPRLSRLPIQWLLARFLCSSMGLRLAGRAGFSVSPPIAGAEYLAVVPGNRRIRVFDFNRNMTRVFLKTGFDPSGMRTETGVRGNGASGPFIPILAVGENWFEEEIHDGYALPRCPPRWNQRGMAEVAQQKLDRWLAKTARSESAAQYSNQLQNRLIRELETISITSEEKGVLLSASRRFAALVSGLGEVELSQGHGDFQPGNVLVSRVGRDVTIIDWEHAAERWREYDRFTWAFQARYGQGLDVRIESFLHGKCPEFLRDITVGAKEKQQMLALFLLEDNLWFVRESCGGPFTRVSEGLTIRIRELPRLVRLISENA